MKKLTFERAIIAVFILIILISTSETTGKYITMIFRKDPAMLTLSESGNPSVFPTMLMTADDLYKAGNYAEAANEYLSLILNSTLSPEQKLHAYFRMAICQYKLKKYALASESFAKAASLYENDSVAYNNAAVSAYEAKDLKRAIELQQKAITILPTVEYYYNLARMYEDNEQYGLAADYYTAVIKGEHNIKMVEAIDPVRVKEKISRLLSKNTARADENENEILMALKSYDYRDILMINDREMKLRKTDFLVKVVDQKNSKNILAEYDINKNDPYGLIDKLVWTVLKNGKEIYRKSGDKISVAAKESGNYVVRLNITYDGTKGEQTTKIVTLQENKSIVDNGTQEHVVTVEPSPAEAPSSYYADSIYEQLFEGDYKTNFSNFTDKYGMVWGKDSGIKLAHEKKLVIDKSNSLIVNNTSDKDAGLWINLDHLLKKENLKGKTITISFYARKITDNADLLFNARVKTDNVIATKERITLLNKYERKSIKVYLPEDAEGLTVSIKTIANEQFYIDGFTVED